MLGSLSEFHAKVVNSTTSVIKTGREFRLPALINVRYFIYDNLHSDDVSQIWNQGSQLILTRHCFPGLTNVFARYVSTLFFFSEQRSSLISLISICTFYVNFFCYLNIVISRLMIFRKTSTYATDTHCTSVYMYIVCVGERENISIVNKWVYVMVA